MALGAEKTLQKQAHLTFAGWWSWQVCVREAVTSVLGLSAPIRNYGDVAEATLTRPAPRATLSPKGGEGWGQDRRLAFYTSP